MNDSTHILIVDDDPDIRSLLREYLQRNGMQATTAADGKAMQQCMSRQRFDLIVLDLMLPGDDGLVLCRNLRAESDIPIVMLTARGDEMDRILGLEMGADDYLPKPFNPRELLARIRSVLRRKPDQSREPAAEGVLGFAGWRLDTRARHLLDSDGTVVALSTGEYRLLHAFVSHPNRVLSRDYLLDLTRGREADPFDRSIDVQVGRLRKRLRDNAREPELIKTVRGEGYLFSARVEQEDGA